LIIGYWPFTIFGQCGDSITLLSMLILSAVEVGICAWIMDKANITKRVWLVLLFAIIACVAITHNLNTDALDSYKQNACVQAAQSSPELKYTFTRTDFHDLYLIPKMIVAGITGLYLATAVSFFWAIATLVWRKTHPTPRALTTPHSP